MAGRLYLVTGDRGFVGARLVQHLLDRGDRVVGADLRPPGRPQGGPYTAVTLDLSDEAAVAELVSSVGGLAAVFHLAAKLPERDDDPLEPHIKSNLRPTENILRALDGLGVPLVLSSTMSVFGLPPRQVPVSESEVPSPSEAYGLCKLASECAAERLARAGRVPAIVLRYSGIFGVGYEYGAVHLYASRVLTGQPIDVYADGSLVRDYVHVEDVVQANLLAAARVAKLGWGLYHIGGGEAQPLLQIAETVAEAAGGGEVRVNDQPGAFDFGFDITRARNELGYQPVPLRARIRQYVEDLRKTGVN